MAPPVYPSSTTVVVSESTQISSTFAGLIGPVLLAVGVFLPALSLSVEKSVFGKDPTFWSIAMKNTHDWQLYAILGIAAGSLLLVAIRLPFLLIFTGLGSLVVLAMTLMDVRAKIEQFYPDLNFAKGDYQFQMGWVFLVAGGLWIFAAGTASLRLGSRRRG